MLVTGSAALFIDQWTKKLVRTHARAEQISLGRVLRIRYLANQRKFYRRHGVPALHVLLWLVALVSAIVLQHAVPRFQSHLATYGLGLAFGGAAGNMVDIIRNRQVVDFIEVRWWPVFNLADVAIVAGLVLAFWPRM
jgi:signal peptidase II